MNCDRCNLLYKIICSGYFTVRSLFQSSLLHGTCPGINTYYITLSSIKNVHQKKIFFLCSFFIREKVKQMKAIVKNKTSWCIFLKLIIVHKQSTLQSFYITGYCWIYSASSADGSCQQDHGGSGRSSSERWNDKR